MLNEVRIRNFKSIVDLKIELGRFNVFIGENGCGKSNILEALATASCGWGREFGVEDLFQQGVRVAQPALMTAAFDEQSADLPITVTIDTDRDCFVVSLAALMGDKSARWHELSATLRLLTLQLQNDPTPEERPVLEALAARIRGMVLIDGGETRLGLRLELAPRWLRDFAIYSAVTPSLRGTETISRRVPLGLHGEGLDVLIAGLPSVDFEELVRRSHFISWLDEVVLDRDDRLKFDGHKLGRSVSTLYFRDRFLDARRNLFSAENANEGVLHALFHLALFVSAETPKVFGIDNLETSLNPRLCRMLTKELAALARERDKQALVTTHNPAVLDGLNLHDDDQRLFVVSRNDDGHTQVKRVRVKPQPEEGTRYMLSELWMRGHLGGIPKHF